MSGCSFKRGTVSSIICRILLSSCLMNCLRSFENPVKQLFEKMFGVKNDDGSSKLLRSGCLVYRNRDPEYINSPEFQFLETYLNRHIQQVFGISADGANPSIADNDRFQYVLWLGDNRTLITAESLKRMKERVDAGAEFVAPTRLESVMGTVSTPPPTTLRMFEEIELELFNVRESWAQRQVFHKARDQRQQETQTSVRSTPCLARQASIVCRSAYCCWTALHQNTRKSFAKGFPAVRSLIHFEFQSGRRIADNWKSPKALAPPAHSLPEMTSWLAIITPIGRTNDLRQSD